VKEDAVLQPGLVQQAKRAEKVVVQWRICVGEPHIGAHMLPSWHFAHPPPTAASGWVQQLQGAPPPWLGATCDSAAVGAACRWIYCHRRPSN